ncbi:hypothetical protein CTAYLR_006138 [Chrysophaeum taylorii]|uniref:RRM domain-containing protein n=1 Tax=Chrysophaeum taylorii TaxID=2483200 RepID=A0AAD7UNK0_9STRA|nr:hypothetical protein CTAYLR_006138 [Chrysophaeum taylorii]
MRLHLGNLTLETTEDEVLSLASKCGLVESVSIPKSPFDGQSRGFGFVSMPGAAAETFRRRYDNVVWRKGRRLRIEPAKPDYRERLKVVASPGPAPAPPPPPPPSLPPPTFVPRFAGTKTDLRDIPPPPRKRPRLPDETDASLPVLRHRLHIDDAAGSPDDPSDGPDELSRALEAEADASLAVLRQLMKAEEEVTPHELPTLEGLSKTAEKTSADSPDHPSDGPDELSRALEAEADASLAVLRQLIKAEEEFRAREPPTEGLSTATAEKTSVGSPGDRSDSPDEVSRALEAEADASLAVLRQLDKAEEEPSLETERTPPLNVEKTPPVEEPRAEKPPASNQRHQWAALRDVFKAAPVKTFAGGLSLSFAASGGKIEHKFAFAGLDDDKPPEEPAEEPAEAADQRQPEAAVPSLWANVHAAIDEGERYVREIDVGAIQARWEDQHAALTKSYRRLLRKIQARKRRRTF